MAYKKVYVPDHPHAMADGCVYEHRLIMEQRIGRFLLPEEQVHHDDGNHKNNNPENLVLCDDQKMHSQQHAYDDDDLIDWLVQYAHEYRRLPYKRECDQNPGMPDSSTFRRHFGTWSEAKRLAQYRINAANFDWREEEDQWY